MEALESTDPQSAKLLVWYVNHPEHWNHDWKPHMEPVVRKKKIGNNDPCPCGSGLKYKKCCRR